MLLVGWLQELHPKLNIVLRQIVSIDLIPPRGCGFVCMNRRMDANRALKNLHKFRLHGKQITLAWAPGKGMKDKQWKDYWDLDLGCSYIPIEKLDPQVRNKPCICIHM